MTNAFDGGRAPVYRRALPGGGYVAIAVTRDEDTPRTRVSVERRAVDDSGADAADPAETQDEQIVIAEADGDERSASFTGMYRIAADNAAIARALLRRQGPGLQG